MFTTSHHTERTHTKKYAFLGIAAAILATSALGTPSAAIARGDRAGNPFGATSGDLAARQDTQDLPVSPIAEDNDPAAAAAAPRSTNRPDMHGESSVENFQGTQPNLSYTHESADGFRKFLEKWWQANFHYKDSGVGSWLFHDNSSSNYDLWSYGGIDYGIDGVRVAFHSSHGNMSNNIFTTSLGRNWANTGWSARSNLMALGGNYHSHGDERLRYMFWDTCHGVRINGGNNPYDTWGPRSKGIRFVFGYETTSVDSPNYGKYFWEEWAKGKTFKYAFLDASWRISTNQTPVLVAFGATQAEATSRRDSEQLLYSGAASNNWGAWSWYNARSTSRESIAEVLTSAPPLGPVEVASRSNSDREVTEIATALGIDVPDASVIISRPGNLKVVRTNALTLAVEENGNFDLFLNTPEEGTDTGKVVTDETLMKRAKRLAGQLSFPKGQDLRIGTVRDLNENVGTDGYQGAHRVTEKTVIFDQTIAGTPFIDPEAGHLEIAFNAKSGEVARVRNTLRAVQPARGGYARAAARTMSIEEARQAALAAFRNAAGADARMASSAETIADSEAIGYQMIDGKAELVYRAHVTSSEMPEMRPFQAIIPLDR